MAFFSLKATCAICGKEVGLNRFLIGKTTSGKEIWKCPECTRKGGYVEIDFVTGKAKLQTLEETEKRVKCNTCGHLYCFNGADLERNRQHAKMAKMNAYGAMGSAIGGTSLDTHAQTNRAQSHLDKIVDYSVCPNCNSTDVRVLSAEEFEREKASKAAGNAPALSSADELMKFKNLLDAGVITQEEFDAKKKQLLGL